MSLVQGDRGHKEDWLCVVKNFFREYNSFICYTNLFLSTQHGGSWVNTMSPTLGVLIG